MYRHFEELFLHNHTRSLIVIPDLVFVLVFGAAVLLLGDAVGKSDGADLDRAAGPRGPRDRSRGVRVAILPSG